MTNREEVRGLLQSALDKARDRDYGPARESLEEIVRQVPDFADGYYYLGLACSRLGDPAGARAAWERCLAIDPFHDRALQSLRELGVPPGPPEEPPPAAQAPAEEFAAESYSQPYLEPAGLGGRFLAWILDSVLLFASTYPFAQIAVGVALAVSSLDLESLGERILEGERLGELFALLAVVTIIGWAVQMPVYCFFLYTSGQTPGKRLLGLRVVRRDGGSELGVGQCLSRFAVLKVTGALCSGLLYSVALFTPWNRAIHDYAAGTIVVRSKAAPPTYGERVLIVLMICIALPVAVYLLWGFLHFVSTIASGFPPNA